MKSYTKSELARAAGVSGDTFRRWLKTDREFLRANNVQSKTKYLPPVVVKYLCEKYCIDVWLVIGDWWLAIEYRRQKEYNEFFTRRIAELEKRAESSENRLKAVTEALRG